MKNPNPFLWFQIVLTLTLLVFVFIGISAAKADSKNKAQKEKDDCVSLIRNQFPEDKIFSEKDGGDGKSFISIGKTNVKLIMFDVYRKKEPVMMIDTLVER